jgi:hypothetical protein
MSVQSKTKRKSHLEADVVMTLFLHEIVAIRNLTTRIQEVDRQLGTRIWSLQSNKRIYRKGK